MLATHRSFLNSLVSAKEPRVHTDCACAGFIRNPPARNDIHSKNDVKRRIDSRDTLELDLSLPASVLHMVIESVVCH